MNDRTNFFQSNSAVSVNNRHNLMDDIKRSAQAQAQWEHSRDQAILDAAHLLQELDQKLDEERAIRQTADEEQMKLTLRWNKINLLVGIAGVIVGFAGVVVAVVALFLN